MAAGQTDAGDSPVSADRPDVEDRRLALALIEIARDAEHLTQDEIDLALGLPVSGGHPQEDRG